MQNSPASPCWQQEQIAAQHSYIDTVKAGRETVYKAPCNVDPRPKAKAAPAPAKVSLWHPGLTAPEDARERDHGDPLAWLRHALPKPSVDEDRAARVG